MLIDFQTLEKFNRRSSQLKLYMQTGMASSNKDNSTDSDWQTKLNKNPNNMTINYSSMVISDNPKRDNTPRSSKHLLLLKQMEEELKDMI